MTDFENIAMPMTKSLETETESSENKQDNRPRQTYLIFLEVFSFDFYASFSSSAYDSRQMFAGHFAPITSSITHWGRMFADHKM